MKKRKTIDDIDEGSRIRARLNDGKTYTGTVYDFGSKNGEPVISFKTDDGDRRWTYISQIIEKIY